MCIDVHQRATAAKECATLTLSTTAVHIVPLPEAKDVLTEILRPGAQKLLAIEAEVADWIDRRRVVA